MEQPPRPVECGFCGTELDDTRPFCSSACREAWWVDGEQPFHPKRMRELNW